MKETINNLQCDWEGMLEWYGVENEDDRREIKKMIAYEIDCYRKRGFLRFFKKTPKWEIFN